MLLPLSLVLIAALLPPLAAQLLRARVWVIILSAALAWAGLAIATLVIAPSPTEPVPGTHPVDALDFTGIEALAFAAFAIGSLLVALVAGLVARLGYEHRPLSVTGFWLTQIGLVAAIAFADVRPPLADIAMTAALAGLLSLAYALVLRPILRRLRRAT